MKALIVFNLKQLKALWIALLLAPAAFLFPTCGVEAESVRGVRYLAAMLLPGILLGAGIFFYNAYGAFDLTLPIPRNRLYAVKIAILTLMAETCFLPLYLLPAARRAEIDFDPYSGLATMALNVFAAVCAGVRFYPILRNKMTSLDGAAFMALLFIFGMAVGRIMPLSFLGKGGPFFDLFILFAAMESYFRGRSIYCRTETLPEQDKIPLAKIFAPVTVFPEQQKKAKRKEKGNEKDREASRSKRVFFPYGPSGDMTVEIWPLSPLLDRLPALWRFAARGIWLHIVYLFTFPFLDATFCRENLLRPTVAGPLACFFLVLSVLLYALGSAGLPVSELWEDFGRRKGRK